MNATIAKIISLLFEDLEETDEVRAIHDEVCQNCQERYEDKIALGLSEDEAIHAVIESLSGMEEMLRHYPRKKEAETEIPESVFDESADSDEKELHFTFDPALEPISEIRAVCLGSTDVEIIPSEDGLVHIDCEDDSAPVLARLQDNVLFIELTEQARNHASVQWKSDFSSSGGGLLETIGKWIDGLARSISASIGGGTLRIHIPSGMRPAVTVDTSSGDICTENVLLAGLHASSTSGDLSLKHISTDQISLAATSGDVRADAAIVPGDVRINTVSGDIRWKGDIGSAAFNTISGDVQYIGSISENLHFKTVSGDVSMILADGRIAVLSGKTTSGDVRLQLPQQPFCIKCRSVSGNIRNALSSDPSSQAVIEIVTTSGDISIR